MYLGILGKSKLHWNKCEYNICDCYCCKCIYDRARWCYDFATIIVWVFVHMISSADTTATTIRGMLPLWLSGAAMFESMVISILFGLIFVTAMTLFFLPVMYVVFSNLIRLV